MTSKKIAPAILATCCGAAALFAATPAHASINDTYVCERNDGRSLTVVIMAMQPGTAVLYDQAESGGEQTQIQLTGRDEGDGFQFSNGGTVFEGIGMDATLDYQRASFICTMPTPQELYDLAMEPRIFLDGHGLTFLRPDRGISFRLPFGMPQEQTIEALEPLIGAPSAPVSNQECPVGPLEFQDFGALTLHYQEGAFVGWSMDEGAFLPARISLPNGAHVGTNGRWIPDWMASFPDSTLGNEYYGDSVHAILSEVEADEQVITHLWGGAACTFR